MISLFYAPLTFFSFRTAYDIQIVLGVALLAIASYCLGRKYFGAIFLTIIISRGFLVSIIFGNFALITNCLLILVFMTARKRHYKTVGVLLGICIAFRIYPLVFLVPLFIFRRKAVVWSLITAAVLMIGAVLVTGYHNFWHEFNWQFHLASPSSYPHSVNFSFASYIWRATSNTAVARVSELIALLGYLVIVWHYCRTFESAFSLSVFAVLLFSPITWGYYFGILAIPAVVYAARAFSIRHPVQIVLVTGLLLVWWPWDLTNYPLSGAASLISYRETIGTFLFGISLWYLLSRVHKARPNSEAINA